MAEISQEHKDFVNHIGQMSAMEILHALAQGKTGNGFYNDIVPKEIVERVEPALDDFIRFLEEQKADDLINKSLS